MFFGIRMIFNSAGRGRGRKGSCGSYPIVCKYLISCSNSRQQNISVSLWNGVLLYTDRRFSLFFLLCDVTDTLEIGIFKQPESPEAVWLVAASRVCRSYISK